MSAELKEKHTSTTRKRQGDGLQMSLSEEDVIVVVDSPVAHDKEEMKSSPQKKKRVNVKFTPQKYPPEPHPFIN